MSASSKAKSLWLHGSSGRMGLEIQKAIAEGSSGFRLIGGSARSFEGGTLHQGRPVTAPQLAHVLSIDKIDLVLDFSTAEGNELLREAVSQASIKGLRVLIGTTGLSEASIKAWKTVAREQSLSLLMAPNTSLGILLMAKAALVAAAPLAKLGFDIEVIETHHRQKRDAPSGTAKFLANTLADAIPGKKVTTGRDDARMPEEIGVHAVRGGGVFGEHEIRIIGDHEEIAITHRAFSRTLFASGALVLAKWLSTKEAGVYGLLDVDLSS